MEGILNEQKFYQLIFSKIQLDMKEKNILLKELADNRKDYIVSHRQYYYIKNVSEGKQSPKLSFSRMNKICTSLGIEFVILYQVNKNGVNILQENNN